MRRVLILFLLLLIIPATVVCATEYTAPEAPDSAIKYMPPETNNFGEGVWYVFKNACSELMPDVTDAVRLCGSIIAVVLLISMLRGLNNTSNHVINLVAILAIATQLTGASTTMIHLAADTITSLKEYGKLLLPTMAASLAAQGGVTASTALYAATALFSAVLTAVISNILIPMIYVYIALSIANAALDENLLCKLRDFTKWATTWFLKIILYVFTGYMTITGVVTGSADASALKAAKLAISGAVPVVGSILSDTSETILVSAGLMKNAAGLYGIIAFFAICLEPFLKIGIQYVLIKAVASIASGFGTKKVVGLIADYSAAMGLALAMTGAVCLLLLISTVCFMKGAV